MQVTSSQIEIASGNRSEHPVENVYYVKHLFVDVNSSVVSLSCVRDLP